ncbi:hypothetical protein AUC69_12640 [Methyloceanibacter superfactus]|uniref:Uncharacterized protein n=1 Tax=Methyloceanibacter superfactus TaxID=1774969 RepID=A0A1E3VUM7_9HYPH|nr:hypothetical protein AUC69_12640 [Methyloceanibacter superfactus]
MVLGVAVLVFFPGGNEGQPVAVLQVDPAPAPPPAASAPQAGAGNFDLPPGFAVTGPASVPSAPRQPAAPQLAPPGQGTTMVPVGPPAMGVPGPGGSLPQPTDRFGEASSPDAPKTAEADAAGTKSDLPQVAAADLTAGIDNTGSIPLPTVRAGDWWRSPNTDRCPRSPPTVAAPPKSTRARRAMRKRQAVRRVWLCW